MITNNVHEILKRQKIGHYDFLKYHFSYDYRRIKLHKSRTVSQDRYFIAFLLWQIYSRTYTRNKKETIL
ncbi:protein of unknown function [Candidatus Nitrosotalea okcheonensis]|uniref:Uncharacterized protein n=1 Tax=Candidatus Nitrosotalea okcheonensis TaxID=1903276 RepID=A0A2H1FDT3_9ARCH|nr:protein of unknown function [Candidatus Nitrosotalea okcheonensis]